MSGTPQGASSRAGLHRAATLARKPFDVIPLAPVGGMVLGYVVSRADGGERTDAGCDRPGREG
jgi:hypothetical protein